MIIRHISRYLKIFICIIIVITLFIITGSPTSTQNNSIDANPVLDVNPVLNYSIDASPPAITIQIVVVIEAETNLNQYEVAIDTLKCYSNIHNYTFRIANDSEFRQDCPNKDKFFRRHCVVAQLLNKADYTLFMDADMGVVNPKRKIEEYIDTGKEIIFYDRFYNDEVTMGAYLVKNTDWSRKFLNDFANYENRLPNSFHGTDNGALHAHLLEVIFPDRRILYQNCLDIYNISVDYNDLFAYESCCRSIMGIGEDFGHIKILRKGNGWARDNWLTNSKWSPERDFIIHGWKSNQLIEYDKIPVPIEYSPRASWYNPFVGSIHLDKCVPGNTTWNYDMNLIEDTKVIKTRLDQMLQEFHVDRFKKLAHLASRLGYVDK